MNHPGITVTFISALAARLVPGPVSPTLAAGNYGEQLARGGCRRLNPLLSRPRFQEQLRSFGETRTPPCRSPAEPLVAHSRASRANYRRSGKRSAHTKARIDGSQLLCR